VNDEEEREAKKRLKGKIWQTVGAPTMRSGRRRRKSSGDWLRVAGEDVQELSPGYYPEPVNPDGWDYKMWGSRPDKGVRRWDPDRAYHPGDWEWNPNVDDRRRAQIIGRERQARVQRDERDEREAVQAAMARALAVEIADQEQAWREWVLREGGLTAKQRAVLTGEVTLTRSAWSHMRGRIDDRVRRNVN
jgi:hypothetical protein